MHEQPTSLFDALKVCKDCERVLPTSDFYAYRAGHLYTRCKSCHYSYTRVWRAKNGPRLRELDRTRYRERYRDKILARKRMEKYGITQDEYEGMLEQQGHVCPICLLPFVQSRETGHWLIASVDHNHETGRVRGILHRRCNLALEFLLNEDDLARAKRYLEEDAAHQC